MITVHPQRWSDSFLPWARELLWQNVKNQVKKYVVFRVQRTEFRNQSLDVRSRGTEFRKQKADVSKE